MHLDTHELVISSRDKKTGFAGFIAVHTTRPGPGIGGTRCWLYPSEDDALRDVLRLSQAMTYKCFFADIPYGGAKAVIIADPRRAKTKPFLAAYASVLNLLNGKFYTGEDVGMRTGDIAYLASRSPFIIGRRGQAGELGPWAAGGVYYAMKPALAAVFGNDSLKGRSIAVKGLGKVGLELAAMAHRDGARVYGADINPAAVAEAKRRLPGITILPPAAIHAAKVDIFSPCALGDELNKQTIPQLRCAIVCGAANNQLSEKEDAQRLHHRNILYVPDYIANAGGLINVAAELNRGGYRRAWAQTKLRNIAVTAKRVIDLAQRRRASTEQVAASLAKGFLKASVV